MEVNLPETSESNRSDSQADQHPPCTVRCAQASGQQHTGTHTAGWLVVRETQGNPSSVRDGDIRTHTKYP